VVDRALNGVGDVVLFMDVRLLVGRFDGGERFVVSNSVEIERVLGIEELPFEYEIDFWHLEARSKHRDRVGLAHFHNADGGARNDNVDRHRVGMK
jgi:hypothetical protein